MTTENTSTETKNVKTGKAKTNGKAKTKLIAGVELAKAQPVCMAAALASVGIDPSEKVEAQIKQLVDYYTEHYEKAALNICDQCGGYNVEADERCPFCGASFKPEAALVPVGPSSLYKVEDLDQSVESIKRLAVESLGSMHALGAALKDNYDRELWKLRLDDEGKPMHRTYRDFCQNEVGLSHTWVYKLMDVASNFTAGDVAQLGTSKLSLLLKAPEQHREKLLEKARAGASVAEVQKSVDRILDKQAKAKEPTPEKERLITIVTKPGKRSVPMMAKPAKKGDELKPAKKLADEPWCEMQLSNDTRLLARIAVESDGTIKLVVQFARNES